MKPKYLITGANGFIGANITHRLIQDGVQVHILQRNNSSSWRLIDVQSKVTKHTVQSFDVGIISKIVKNIQPDYIIHLASYGNSSSQTSVHHMIESNIIFTTNLLDALQSFSYTSCVVVGSSSEYGFKDTPMKESDLLVPASFYAATKASATHIATTWQKVYNKPICVVRPFSVYGRFEEGNRLIPTAIIRCLRSQKLFLTPGKEARDFIYIDDFIDGLLVCLHQPEKSSGKIINIGSGSQYSTKQVVEIIAKLTQTKSKLLWGTYPNRSWDALNWQADISLAKNLFSWSPNYSLEAGLRQSVEWFKTHISLYETQ